MKLFDAIRKILDMDDEQVIFAKKPWVHETEAVISKLVDHIAVPEELKRKGFAYFLEKPIVEELMEIKTEKVMTLEQVIDFVIYYADNDAYPAWVDDLPDR